MGPPVLRGTGTIGVALVHDITGLDKTNLWFAEKLHADGFFVKSVDLFDGKVAKDVQEGMALRQAVSWDQVRAKLRSAHDELRAAMPEGGKIGTMGFCMGGGAALDAACHLPFDFCVDYYGTSASAEDVARLRGPLLLILASQDERVNAWAFSQLLPQMARHQKRAEVQLYASVVHPFHRPDWITSPFGGMKSYDEAAATDAWARAVAFLRARS